MILMSSTTFLVVGLNAALQKRFVMDETMLIPGNVHRAKMVTTGVGGKGQDVACALTVLVSCNDDIRLVQFLGMGSAGDTVRDVLKDRFGLSMEYTLRSSAAVRTCTSIVSADATTELVEPSGVVSEEEFEALLKSLEDMKITISALCCMGSLPPGCPNNAYQRIYKIVMHPSLYCVVDSTAGLDSFLEIADPECTMLKVNVAEFCHFLGVSRPAVLEASGHPIEIITFALREFRQRGYRCRVALTDGAHGAYACENGTILKKYDIPKLDTSHPLFPIGAGDAVAAGLLYAWQQQWEDPFAFGLACGSASCLHEENSIFERDVALEFYNQRKPAEIIRFDSEK